MSKLRTISLGETDKLKLDEENKLYWDGKPIVTEEKLVLQKHINWAVYLTAFSTAAYALVEVLKLFGCGTR
jgi:hypothetical protein